MAIKYIVYKDEDGLLAIVEEGSEAQLNLTIEAEAVVIPALEQQTSDDGQTNESNGAGNLVIVDTHTYAAGEERVINHATLPNASVQAFTLVDTLGSPTQLTSVAGWDPLNRSSLEANIRDNNLTNLAYNNQANGQAAGFILGLDMGTAVNANMMQMFDWTNATYIANEWEFIGTNDSTGLTYDSLFTVTGHVQSVNPNPFERSFGNQLYRYYGVRCIVPNNNSFFVLSEIRVFDAPVLSQDLVRVQDDQFTVVRISDTQTKIINNGPQITLTVEVKE